MNNIIKSSLRFSIISVLLFVVSLSFSQTELSSSASDYIHTAERIRSCYEEQAFLLSPAKAGHMGLRLYRNSSDPKYRYLLLQGINYTCNSLDKLIKQGLDPSSINRYAQKINKDYKASTEKKRLRKRSLDHYPLYRIYACKFLRHVARLDELGLRHESHDEIIALLESYDFKTVFTDSMMIRAWGAQLANQVYWLNQLGLGDYRKEFCEAVSETYPAELDDNISNQQFGNKIYTLTHIIIAASEYYRYPVDYKRYNQITDYFRNNIDSILKRCKEDIIIEVGLSLLLVNDAYPEIDRIRSFIQDRVNKKSNIIHSVNGSDDIPLGEHRNIIAILLLDWRGCNYSPGAKEIAKLSSKLPANLEIIKHSDVKS